MYLVFAALLLTIVSLLLGLISMVIGKNTNKKYGTKLMSLRVSAQALTIILLLIAIFYSNIN